MFKDILRCSHYVLRKIFSRCSQDVLKMFSGCTRDVLKMFSWFIIDTLVCVWGLVGMVGCVGLVGLVGRVGLVRVVGLVGPRGFLGVLDLAGLHKLFHTAMPDGRTRSKLGELGKHFINELIWVRLEWIYKTIIFALNFIVFQMSIIASYYRSSTLRCKYTYTHVYISSCIN